MLRRRAGRERHRSTPESEAWFGLLRARFLEVAGRRVSADAAEEVVQEALRVVAGKKRHPTPGFRVDGSPALVWCFRVLRDTIASFYERERAGAASEVVEMPPVPRRDRIALQTPLAVLGEPDLAIVVQRAIDALDHTHASCARYLRRLAQGVTPTRLAAEEGMEIDVLCRQIHRCRRKLRTLLRQEGYSP